MPEAATLNGEERQLEQSRGLDEAILFLIGQARNCAKLSLKCDGERALLAAVRATVLADAATSLARDKRHKPVPLSREYRGQIHHARDLAARAFLAQRCTRANAAFRCTRRADHKGRHQMEPYYATT